LFFKIPLKKTSLKPILPSVLEWSQWSGLAGAHDFSPLKMADFAGVSSTIWFNAGQFSVTVLTLSLAVSLALEANGRFQNGWRDCQ